jgi:hypothetical protein
MFSNKQFRWFGLDPPPTKNTLPARTWTRPAQINVGLRHGGPLFDEPLGRPVERASWLDFLSVLTLRNRLVRGTWNNPLMPDCWYCNRDEAATVHRIGTPLHARHSQRGASEAGHALSTLLVQLQRANDYWYWYQGLGPGSRHVPPMRYVIHAAWPDARIHAWTKP